MSKAHEMPGLSRGSRRACLAHGQRFHSEAAGLLDVPQVRERAPVRRVGTDGEGRRRQITGTGLGFCAGCTGVDPCREPGPQPGGLKHQFQELLLLVVQFADRGQHPGRGPAGSAAGRVIDQHHGPARAAGLEGDAMADHPAADHCDVGGDVPCRKVPCCGVPGGGSLTGTGPGVTNPGSGVICGFGFTAGSCAQLKIPSLRRY